MSSLRDTSSADSSAGNSADRQRALSGFRAFGMLKENRGGGDGPFLLKCSSSPPLASE